MCYAIIEIPAFLAGFWIIFSGRLPSQVFRVLFGKGQYNTSPTKARLFGLFLAFPFLANSYTTFLPVINFGKTSFVDSFFINIGSIITIAIVSIIFANKIRKPKIEVNVKSMQTTLFLFGLAAIIAVYVGYTIYTIIPSFFGDSFGEAIAWVDNNGNGLQDVGEPPLEGVCVWADSTPSIYDADQTENVCATSYNHTDRQGRWARFFAGGYCRDIYIFAEAPEGYQPTTSLGGNGCIVKFGFAPQGTLEKTNVLSPSEYAQSIIRTQFIDTLKQWALFAGVIILDVFVSIILASVLKKSR